MKNKLPFLWIGIAFGCLSLIVILLSFFPDWLKYPTAAIAFLALAALSSLLQHFAPAEWDWQGWLYLPTAAFGGFGIVFLLNTLTGDWSAWAYAWLLCLTGIFAGMVLSIRATGKIRFLYPPFLWGMLGSLSLGCIFGAIAGGLFMKVFILLLLIGIGTGLFLAWRKGFTPLAWTRLEPAAAGAPAVGAVSAQVEPLIEPLSKREIEVLQWISQGLTNAEIAGRLVVAQSTVKTHINNIYTKLGVRTRTAALLRARQLNVIA